MAAIPEDVRRRMISDDLRAQFEASIQQRVDRYIEISHQDVIPNHHFAEASAQCIRLYTDGYFLSAIMVTQAVAEGIRKFVAERNEIKRAGNTKFSRIISFLAKKGIISKKYTNGIKNNGNMKGPRIIRILVKKGIISRECAGAFNQIWKSFRNDVHHMNPTVAKIPEKISFLELARRNIQALAGIEREIFAVRLTAGALIPLKPLYWDIEEGGTADVFLRCSP